VTEQQWIGEAREAREALSDLVAMYHPANRQPGRRSACATNGYTGDYITAPNAEAACVQVRKGIRDTHQGDPVAQLDAALTAGDWRAVNNLLNAAWFGVPESTSCWGIPGFREAVGLMEDLPEEEAA
jgi:hypothetical protein